MSLWNRPEEKGGCESFGGRERLTMMGRTEDPRLQQEVVGRVSGRWGAMACRRGIQAASRVLVSCRAARHRNSQVPSQGQKSPRQHPVN